MRQRIFVDMDGTLARFHDEVKYLERMFEKGFFLNLKPFNEAIAAINAMLASKDFDVYILSAAVDGEPPFCQAEKNMWLDKYCPHIDTNHRIFTKMGHPKSEFIPGGIAATDILWDDYNKNLKEWQEAGGIAVKCHNNINHKGLIGSLWEGEIARNDMAPAALCEYFRSFSPVAERASADEEYEQEL